MTSGEASTRGLDQDVPRTEADEWVDRVNWYVACLKDCIAGSPVRGLAEAEAGFAFAIDETTTRIAEIERENETAAELAATLHIEARAAEARCEALAAALREIAIGPSEVSPPEIARCALGWPAHGWGEPYADVPGAGQRGCG